MHACIPYIMSVKKRVREREAGKGRDNFNFLAFIFINFYVIYLIESKKETKQTIESLRTIRYQVQLCKILFCLLELEYVLYYNLNFGPPPPPKKQCHVEMRNPGHSNMWPELRTTALKYTERAKLYKDI